jgi:hypothetical protein
VTLAGGGGVFQSGEHVQLCFNHTTCDNVSAVVEVLTLLGQGILSCSWAPVVHAYNPSYLGG